MTKTTRDQRHIVPGDFGGDGKSDLFLYDKYVFYRDYCVEMLILLDVSRNNERGVIYTCYENGVVAKIGNVFSQLGQWDHVVVGQFRPIMADRRSMTQDLMVFSKSNNIGRFYATDRGKVC